MGGVGERTVFAKAGATKAAVSRSATAISKASLDWYSAEGSWRGFWTYTTSDL